MRIFLVLVMLFIANAAIAAEPSHFIDSAGKVHLVGKNGKELWWDRSDKPSTLKAAIEDYRGFAGADHGGWKMNGPKFLCKEFSSVGLACDYNTRGELVMFLEHNGKVLFPPSGKTNPYCEEEKDRSYGACYIGQPIQNKMLAESIRRNKALFKEGDLTAATVKDRWR